jgi:hypothetical protein
MATFYRKARNHIAELWLDLELKSLSKIEAGLHTQIKNSQILLVRDILPIFSGVLRKMEGKSFSKRSESIIVKESPHEQ